MMQKRAYVLVGGLAALAFGASACSSETSSGGTGGSSTGGGSSSSPSCQAGTCPVDIGTTDLTTPEISFKTDVYPIFEASCNDESCHGLKDGSASGVAAGLLLGNDPKDGAPSDAVLGQTYSSLTGTSNFAPAMQRVKPGDWENSFLMLKVDGCQNSGVADCSGSSVDGLLSVCDDECGDGMPQVSSTGPNVDFPLGDADILTLRKWIAQGAKNN